MPRLRIWSSILKTRSRLLPLGTALVVAMTLGLAGCQRPKKKDAENANNGRVRNDDPASFLPRGNVGSKVSYRNVSTQQPLIAITFDDGPHPQNTPRLLDILRQRNVKATFYVVGTNVKRYPGIMRRIVAEGHEVGNHTVSHSNMTKMSANAIRSDLRRAHQEILATTGVAPRTMRPPYGAISQGQKQWIRGEFGYPSILWSVDPEDWKRPGSRVVAQRLINGARPGGILLAHDIHSPTIDAVPETLDTLKSRGFKFVTVTQLISQDGR